MTEAERMTVLLVEPDQEVVGAARAAFTAKGMAAEGTTADRTRLSAEVRLRRPEIVILDGAAVQGELADTVRELIAASPDLVIVVTASNATSTALSRAVVAGARGFLLKPYRVSDLVETARDALLNARARHDSQPPAAAPRTDGGSLIAVYSPKGGVGATTVSALLALSLATRSRKSVAIVDLDLQFGDVGVLLDLKGTNSMIDLVGREDLDEDGVIDEVFVRHASGVRALLAPERLNAIENLDPTRAVKTLSRLRAHFDYVVCDTWSSLDGLSAAVLLAADRVLFVVTPEVPALHNLQRVLNEVPSLRSESRSLVVLNRYPGRVGLTLKEVERGLGRPVSATIPSRGVEIGQAVNEGFSATAMSTNLTLNQSIAKLADLVQGETGSGRASATIQAIGTA